ncbi:MAG: hypothetical protein ACUVQG_06625 [Thermogutta sp.]
MRTTARITLPIVFLLGVAAELTQVQAYNPPVDSASGITVRIEGPSEVDGNAPFPITLIVDNSRPEPIRGSIRIGLIDGFSADPPGPFTVEVSGKGAFRKEVQIHPGERVFNAHYPVHAWAVFDSDNAPVRLHPILIFQMKNVARQAAPAWKWMPLTVPERGQLALEEIPIRRAVMQVFNQPAEAMPTGWQGSHPVHRGALNLEFRSLGGVNRRGLMIHPPWFEGRAGTALVEFPLNLPQIQPIKLRFALGMQPEGQSDGVTCRVRVAKEDVAPGEFGAILFERHTATKEWEEHEVDLSQFAGQNIRLQLESHPGPKNNTGWDSSFWAEPTLVIGKEATPSSEPEAPGRAVVLGTGQLNGQPVRYEVVLGSRGLLDSEVRVQFQDRQVSFRGFEVTVLGSRIDRSRSGVGFVSVETNIVPKPTVQGHDLVVRHYFNSFFGKFDLVGSLTVSDGILVADFAIENAPQPQPWQYVYVQDVAFGSWSEDAFRVYAGPGNVVEKPEAYTLGFDGHRLSTSFVGLEFANQFAIVQACNVPPTSFVVDPSSNHASLHTSHACRFVLVPATSVWEGVKIWREINQLKPSAGVKKLAGRFVFDLWGGHYRSSADALKKSFHYGLTDSLVIWHNWQRWGYDYRLPEVYPPNPQYGSLEDMQYLAETCRQAGVLFALHDNYIDFYPDADGFSYLQTIAFHESREPVRAWFNEGRQAQSYRYRADQIDPFLKKNLAIIAENIGPTAYFIDVWSSISPYDYWTADGQFFDKIFTRKVWGEHFAWIRKRLGGDAPQISESGHDQLIGWLDGATSNHLRVGEPLPGYYRWSVWNWKCADAERVPWFDAAHHDRFILHGAGYSGRYQAGLNALLHGIYSDDYITTEVLTGHPAMVSEPFGAEVVRKYWLLAPLGRALALVKLDQVEFVDGDLHRIHVRWENGVETWCNRGSTDWNVGGHVIPQYGFLARIPSTESSIAGQETVIMAAISRRDGVIAESVVGPSYVYVNGRKDYFGSRRIRPVATGFTKSGRTCQITVRWSAPDGIPNGYIPFAHFCDAEGKIVFQGPFGAMENTVAKGELQSVIQVAVPDSLKPGTALELRVGLYRPQGGSRLRLDGPDDGELRIRLGKLTITNDSSFEWAKIPEQGDQLSLRSNPEGRKIDFGCVVTAQAVRLTLDGNRVRVMALPLENVTTTAEIIWEKLPWKLPAPTKIEYLDIDGRVLKTEDLNGASPVSVSIVPPAVECRITAAAR